jgi:hypothetical protein
MLKKLGLVGVGSLGGHIAEKIQDHVDTIYAVDPDIVEERNVRNSIYTEEDINKPKVMALKEKIKRCKIIPVKADIKMIDLPSVDQVIDCRDVVNRNIDTNVKFSIVGKSLRIDCSEVHIEEDVPGRYLVELEKPEISQAGSLATDVMMSNCIQTLFERKLSVHVPIATKDIDFAFNLCLNMNETGTTELRQEHLEVLFGPDCIFNIEELLNYNVGGA